jgi:diguanylate cyclase
LDVQDPIAIIQSVGHSIGLIALLILVYSEIVQRLAGWPLLCQLATGILFGSGAIVSMFDPVVLAEGVVADLRLVSIALSGPFGGPLAALICGTFAAAFRFFEGGVGTLSGIAGIAIAVVATTTFVRLVAPEAHLLRARHLFALGAISSVSFVSALLLPPPISLAFFQGVAAPLTVATIIGVAFLGTLMTRELRRIRAEGEVRAHALTDPLTKLPNRRALDEALMRAFHHARRHELPLTVLFLDIDHFKKVNDEYGHEAGDAALVGVADILSATTRASDFVARYGGEEFVLLLPSTPVEGGLHQSERLRKSVEATPVQTGVRAIDLTISIGMAVFDPQITSPEELLKLADDALLMAKAQGRNQVHVAATSASQATRLRVLGRATKDVSEQRRAPTDDAQRLRGRHSAQSLSSG